jgi:hypothetical protein
MVWATFPSFVFLLVSFLAFVAATFSWPVLGFSLCLVPPAPKRTHHADGNKALFAPQTRSTRPSKDEALHQIWTEDTINSNLKQIEYFYESGFFNSKKDALHLCDLYIEEF